MRNMISAQMLTTASPEGQYACFRYYGYKLVMTTSAREANISI